MATSYVGAKPLKLAQKGLQNYVLHSLYWWQ